MEPPQLPQKLLTDLGLKKAKFSDLIEGEEFNCKEDFIALTILNLSWQSVKAEIGSLKRKVMNGIVTYADNSSMPFPETWKDDAVVYVRL